IMVVKAKSGSDALKPPTDYQHVWNPADSSSFWNPVPPTGYKALGSVAGRQFAGRQCGQVPRLGVAVALVADADRAVHVRHGRHRARVRAWRGRKRRPRVASGLSAGRICPVQRRIDCKEMRQMVAVGIDQLIDPFHAHRHAPSRLDGEGRVVEGARMVDRTVAPDGARAVPGRKDLLPKLPHRDLIVVSAAAPLELHRAARGHRGRDDQRCDDALQVAEAMRGVAAHLLGLAQGLERASRLRGEVHGDRGGDSCWGQPGGQSPQQIGGTEERAEGHHHLQQAGQLQAGQRTEQQGLERVGAADPPHGNLQEQRVAGAAEEEVEQGGKYHQSGDQAKGPCRRALAGGAPAHHQA
ncbi:MAG: Vps62-related protein, partial [Thiobacillus sp.]|nr:Vps62-related protein [Thiobacillus sp.]